jgi:hypothetical protein
MSIKIIDNACKIEDGKLVIVVEGPGPEEVLSANARSLAIQKAASCGYAHVGVNGQSGSYPVDSDGKTYEDVNEQARRGLISAYRNEIRLMGGL